MRVILHVFILLCLNYWSFGYIGNLGRARVFSNTKALTSLNARVARREDEQQKEEASNSQGQEMVTIPFNGLIGEDAGSLFETPISTFDPTKDTDDLPGEDDSPEKIAAIQKRIQQRVEELKKAGEWEITNEEFGKNPLANIPLWQTMIYQIQNCKPFESYDELGLTYSLVIFTSGFIFSYLLFMKVILEGFMTWYIETDFDFLSSIIRNS